MNDSIKITPDLDIRFCDLMRKVDVDCEFTLRDIIRAAASSSEIRIEDMSNFLQCAHIISYYKEMIGNPFQDNGNIDYLELYWIGDTDCYEKGHKRTYSSMWGFHGVGKLGEIPNDCPEQYESLTPEERITFRERYAVELSPIYTLSDYKIQISKEMIINDNEEKDYNKRTQTIKFQPTITLLELMYWIFWELSFFGDPEERNEQKKDLIGMVDEIKKAEESGTLDKITTPWEEVKKEMEERMRKKYIKAIPQMDVSQEKSEKNP